MRAVATIFYLIPMAIIAVGWLRQQKARPLAAAKSLWRGRFVAASLIIVGCATLTGFASSLNWLSLGGDPHGMGTPVGPWQALSRFFIALLILGTAFALVGKGKGRFPAIGAAFAAFFAHAAVILVQMD
jgi:hypothetical protein